MKLIQILTCLFILNSIALADTKVATVDTVKLMNALRERDPDNSKLEEDKDGARAILKDKQTELKDLEQEIRSKKLTKDTTEVKEFQVKAQEYEKFVKQNQETLRNRQLNVYKRLSDQAYKAIKEYSSANDIELVLDKSSDAPGAVLFGKSDADITKDIMDKLGL